MKKSLIVAALFVIASVLMGGDVQRSQAASLLPTIAVGTNPQQMQLTPDGSKLLVSNEAAGTVSIINTATDSVLNTINVGTNFPNSGPGPIRVLPDGSKAYVVNELNDTVSAINVATNSLITNIPVGTNPVTLSRTDDGTKVYVANKLGNTVTVIDTATDAVVGGPIAVGTAPNTMAKTPDGTKLYVANETSNNISVISTSSSTIIATISLGTSKDPGSIHFLPNGTKAYVANRGCVAANPPVAPCLSSVAPTVSVIDVASNSLATTISIGAVGDAPHAMRTTLNGSKLYVVNKHGNAVKVIDTGSNTVIKTVQLQAGSCTSILSGAGACPVRIELSPDGSYAYIVEERPLAVEGTLTAICTGTVPTICGGSVTDAVVWRSVVGNSPVDLEVTPGGKAYISNSGSNTVSVWVDSDGDGCPNANEQQTAIGSELSGGRRDYLNPWDYFEPTHNGQVRINDIITVVNQYFKDQYLDSPPNPPNTPNPAYTKDTDRTSIGPNGWNLGPPNGQQRVDDILRAVKQYFHDCP